MHIIIMHIIIIIIIIIIFRPDHSSKGKRLITETQRAFEAAERIVRIEMAAEALSRFGNDTHRAFVSGDQKREESTRPMDEIDVEIERLRREHQQHLLLQRQMNDIVSSHLSSDKSDQGRNVESDVEDQTFEWGDDCTSLLGLSRPSLIQSEHQNSSTLSLPPPPVNVSDQKIRR